MHRKILGRNWLWPNQCAILAFCGGTEENNRKPENIQCAGRRAAEHLRNDSEALILRYSDVSRARHENCTHMSRGLEYSTKRGELVV